MVDRFPLQRLPYLVIFKTRFRRNMAGLCLFGTLPIRQSNLEDLVHETPVSWIQGQVDWLQLFSLQLVTVTFILIEILKHSA